jgi:hypothetical protein
MNTGMQLQPGQYQQLQSQFGGALGQAFGGQPGQQPYGMPRGPQGGFQPPQFQPFQNQPQYQPMGGGMAQGIVAGDNPSGMGQEFGGSQWAGGPQQPWGDMQYQNQMGGPGIGQFEQQQMQQAPQMSQPLSPPSQGPQGPAVGLMSAPPALTQRQQTRQRFLAQQGRAPQQFNGGR